MSEVSTTAGTGSLRRLPSGTVVDDRYEIIDFLGEGGFANVYKAQHVHIKRLVALKLLDQRKVPGTCEFEQRFVREAQTAAQIDHPNVVTIHDFGFYGEKRQPYIAMELLHGHDLEQELDKNGRLDPERALPLFVTCLEALGEAHRAGIVHKDLKPSNLFLSHAGTDREALLILDFGVASISADSAKRLTSTGQILGTPQYLAPEYIQDQLALPTFDVYQMGLIIAETLTGYPLIDAENPFQCLMAHCKANYTVPERLLASPLGPILQHALDVDHTARYPDADAFRAALVELNPGTVPHLEDADLDRSVRITDAVTGNAETMAALEHFSRQTDEEKFESRRVGDAQTAPGELVAAKLAAAELAAGTGHQLAAAGDERGIAASMASLEALEPAAGSNRGLILGIAVVALVLCMAIAFVVMSGETTTDEGASGAAAEASADEAEAGAEGPTEPAAEPVAEPEPTPASLAADGATEAAAGGGAEGALAAASETPGDEAEAEAEAEAEPVEAPPVTLFLASDPTGATVYHGDEKVGRTPTRTEVPVGEDALVFRFEKSGYADIEESIVPKESTQVVAVLQRKRRRRDDKKDPRKTGAETEQTGAETSGSSSSDGGTVMIAP